MIEAKAIGSYIILFAIAGGCGAIGGVVAELLQKRGTTADSTGQLERPRMRDRLVDLGWWASVAVGLVASVAALWVFPPEQIVSISSDNIARLSGVRYDLVRVVALSLIVGSAGSVFLTTLQDRALTAAREQKAATLEAVTKRQLDKLDSLAQANEPSEKMVHAIATARAAIGMEDRDASPGVVTAIPGARQGGA